MGNLGAFVVLFCLLVEINCIPLSNKAQSPTEAVACKPNKDIAILADISRSMLTNERKDLIEVVKSLINEVGVSEAGHHFGFVTYAVNATLHSNFSNPYYHNASNLKETVQVQVKVEPEKDATRTDLAMELVLTELFSSNGGDRPNAKNVLIIITDGNPVFINTTWDNRTRIPLQKFLEPLKEKDIDTWAILVGPKAEQHKKDLKAFAGDLISVFVSESFEELREKFLKEFKNKFCEPSCPKDVAFILDSSRSIKNEDFNEEKEIVKKLMTDLDIGPDKDRVALALFGATPKLKAGFGQYEASTFQDVLRTLPKMNDRTRIDRALNLAVDKIFPSARQGVYKIAMILTDGVQSAEAQGLMPSSKPLRDAGVRVIAVGIGHGKQERRLRLMTDRAEDVVDAKNIQGHLQEILGDLDQNGCNPLAAQARNPGPAECKDDPDFARECRKKATDKSFCWDNPDFCYINCQKSCGLCPSS